MISLAKATGNSYLVHWQNTPTLSSKIDEESDFSDTAYNSTYVSDVQSLIAKSTSHIFLAKNI